MSKLLIKNPTIINEGKRFRKNLLIDGEKLISISLTILESSLGIYNEAYGSGPLSAFFSIITLIPSISVTSRRLQDRGISGWWQLSYITFIGIFVITILCMLPAKEDENKWGRNPLLDM